MAHYRHHLPQLSNDLFLTDGGIETTLIFREGFDLPEFAAFDLLKHKAGYQALANYFRTYARIACNYQVGLVLESATWRANASAKSHAELNESVTLDDGNPTELGSQYQALKSRLRNLNVLGGCCGTDDRHIEAICKACLPLFWSHPAHLNWRQNA
jgi:S-methylmethionine-dependent homocysteine/selenocysteine methylase